MKTGEVCLLYPPLSVHEFPHMALPLLKGFLAVHGHNDVVIRDFNVDIMSNIIKNGLEKIETYFGARNMRMTVPDIEKNLDIAWKTLADKDDRGKDERAFRLINTYLKIAGMKISDTCFCPGTFDEIIKKYESCDFQRDGNMIIAYIRDKIIPYLESRPPRVLGITVPFASQIFYGLLIGREIKRHLPDIHVLYGGAQISMFWKLLTGHELFRQSYDGLVYGNGEQALLQYLENYRNDKKRASIPNLIYFDETNNLRVNPQAPPCDIRELPVPDFSGMPLDSYAYPKLPYILSQGCYWARCAFCSYRNNRGYSMKTVEQIVRDIKQMKETYGRRHFHFIDDSLHPELIKKVARALVDQGVSIKYESYLRLDARYTRELCQLLARSGMRSALFGLESGNPRVLKIMNKGINLREAKTVLRNMKEAGIRPVLSCIIGFPTETKKEAWDSVLFLKENRELYQQAFIVHYGLISDMYENTDDYGIVSVDLDNPVRYDDAGFLALGYAYKTDRGMSTQQAYDVMEEARRELNIQKFEDCFFS